MSRSTFPRSSALLRRLLVILSLLPGAVLAASLAPPNKEGIVEVTAEQLIELAEQSDKLVIIDSRLVGDVKRGRIERALSLPNNEMTAEKLALLASRDQIVLFYCNGRRCPRSHEASVEAVAWGWQHVYWFPGGVEEWTAKGYPLVVVAE